MEGDGSLRGQELQGTETQESSPSPVGLGVVQSAWGEARARPSRGPTRVHGGSRAPGVRVTSTAGRSWTGVKPVCSLNGRSSDDAQRPRAGSQGGAGPGRQGTGPPRAGIRLGCRSAPCSPPGPPPRHPQLARPVAPRSSQPAEGAVVPRSLSRAGAGRKFQCYFRRGAVGWAVQLAGEGTGPAVAKLGRDRGPRNVPNRRLGLGGRCGRRNAVPARLPEDYLRVPAASGCDSGLLGHPGPRAAGAPGRVTRSLPASDPELHPFHCHYKHGGARRAVSPPDR